LAIEKGGQLFTEAEVAKLANESPGLGAERHAASMLVVPIRNQQSVIGVLSIQSYRTSAFTQFQLNTLHALAEHCGGALDRIRTEEELHRTQEQLRQSQKLEAIGQLAGGVAHDFNNLLTVMRGNTELVLMCPAQLTPAAKECLNQVRQAIDRAASLTRQLLAFSRKQRMELHPLDLNEVVANLANMLQRLIGEDVQLRPSYAPKLPMVHADSGMLEQAIINLAVNARDAMPKGG